MPNSLFILALILSLSQMTAQSLTPTHERTPPPSSVAIPQIPPPADGPVNTAVFQDAFFPDLLIDDQESTIDPTVENVFIAPNSCAVKEGCAVAGNRKLLRFNTRIINQGLGDLIIGDPYHDVNQTFFHYNLCHEHFHWPDVLRAKLLDASGHQVAAGMKIGFCMTDFLPHKYDCAHQGIAEGWSDLYHKWLDCQWIDVSHVPAGNYTLALAVNENRAFMETNYDNNGNPAWALALASTSRYDIIIMNSDVTPLPPPATNSDCTGAVPLQTDQHFVFNSKGGHSQNLSCNGVSQPQFGLWFSIIGTGERFLVSTCNPSTTTDTSILVFRDCKPESASGVGSAGCNVHSLSCVAANDDDQCGAAAYLQFCTARGATYYINVGGSGPLTGVIDLTVQAIRDDYYSLFTMQPARGEECSGPVYKC